TNRDQALGDRIGMHHQNQDGLREVEAEDEGQEEGDDTLDQPRTQLDQVIQERGPRGFDFVVDGVAHETPALRLRGLAGTAFGARFATGLGFGAAAPFALGAGFSAVTFGGVAFFALGLACAFADALRTRGLALDTGSIDISTGSVWV